MAPTAKLATTARVPVMDGDDSLGSGYPKAGVIRGQGNLEPGFQSGGPSQKVVYVASWDDSIDGHIPLGGSMGLGVYVPAGFVVTEVSFDVEVVPVGPTNMFFSLEADGDLVDSAAINGAPWSTTGLKHGKNAGASAVNVAYTVQGPFTTAAREIAIGGTVAASSAGRVVIYVEGFKRPAAVTQGASLDA